MEPARTSRRVAPMPVGFHGDRYLLELVDLLAARAKVFLETGANVGSTLGYVARRFPQIACLSCEPDQDAFNVALSHACVRPGVRVLHESSQQFLQRLDLLGGRLFEKPALLWLDAHGHGFEWPLVSEVAFFTRRFRTAYLLIDDFRVPSKPQFGYDRHAGQECSFETIQDAIGQNVHWRLYYPRYDEHTSTYHPLRGWGLIQFGRLPVPSLIPLAPGILHLAETGAPCGALR